MPKFYIHANLVPILACTDSEGGEGEGGGQGVQTPPPQREIKKKIRFPSNTRPDPLKFKKLQASIQWWAIISTPAKRHLSYDVASGSEITPCNKIDKPLVVYRFSGNVMTSITTLCT